MGRDLPFAQSVLGGGDVVCMDGRVDSVGALAIAGRALVGHGGGRSSDEQEGLEGAASGTAADAVGSEDADLRE